LEVWKDFTQSSLALPRALSEVTQCEHAAAARRALAYDSMLLTPLTAARLMAICVQTGLRTAVPASEEVVAAERPKLTVRGKITENLSTLYALPTPLGAVCSHAPAAAKRDLAKKS
jgi:hypothetical protein